MVLVGSEVKSIRNGKISIEEAYARVFNGELWLIDCDIAEYPQANLMNHLAKRTRKLLLRKRELEKVAEAATAKGADARSPGRLFLARIRQGLRGGGQGPQAPRQA